MDNKVLAKVNGREITELDLRNTIAKLPRERQNYFNTKNGMDHLLEQIISFELVYNFAKENKMDSDKEYLVQIENAEKELLTQHALSKVLAEVDVTEDEIVDFYKENQSMFVEQESVRAKHILVDTLEEAIKVADEIKSGLSFEDAAPKYSMCPSNAQGGDLGTFTKGKMVPEFEAAAFTLEVGVVSEPVQTQFGYHLIKVEEKNEASTKPLDAVKDSVKKNILQEKQSKKYTELTNSLKEKYTVEYLGTDK